MTGSSGMILAVVILLVFSSLFSAIETAFSCASKIRLKNMASDGDSRATEVLHILENYDFLSVEEKNQLWKLVLEKVTVFRSQEDELMIHIYPNLPK